MRAGGLQQKVQSGILIGSGADRMPPAEQLRRIKQTVSQLMEEQYEDLLTEVLPGREGLVGRERQRDHRDRPTHARAEQINRHPGIKPAQ